jgi:hypothetical protein
VLLLLLLLHDLLLDEMLVLLLDEMLLQTLNLQKLVNKRSM